MSYLVDGLSLIYIVLIRLKTLDTEIKRENNNFDLIRSCAALGVILGHSFYLNNTNGCIDPVKYIISFEYTGSIAVYLFFS